MAAAQAGDRVAYETLLRECVSFIAGVARRGPHPKSKTFTKGRPQAPSLYNSANRALF